jgi:hypothetical protein
MWRIAKFGRRVTVTGWSRGTKTARLTNFGLDVIFLAYNMKIFNITTILETVKVKRDIACVSRV